MIYFDTQARNQNSSLVFLFPLKFYYIHPYFCSIGYSLSLFLTINHSADASASLVMLSNPFSGASQSEHFKTPVLTQNVICGLAQLVPCENSLKMQVDLGSSPIL